MWLFDRRTRLGRNLSAAVGMCLIFGFMTIAKHWAETFVFISALLLARHVLVQHSKSKDER